MVRRIALIGLALVLLSATWCGSQQASWPRWQGPNGDGISTETGWNPLALSGGAKVLWTVNVGVGYSSFAIQDDRLYTMGAAEGVLSLSCLDATTGKVIWKSPYEMPSIPQSTPTVDGDRVYGGLSIDGTLLCVQAGDGKPVWQKNLESEFHASRPEYGWATSPIVEGDVLLVNANRRALALDKSNGRLVWAIDDPQKGNSYSSVVVSDIGGVRCALFAMPSMLCAVDVKTGKMLWSFSNELLRGRVGQFATDPVVFGGRIFYSYFAASLEPAGTQAKVLWDSPVAFGLWPSPVLLDGYLYGSQWPDPFDFADWATFQRMSADFSFICMDWSTGQVMWQKQMPCMFATAADGKIIALEVSGTLHIAEVTPSGYRELSSADVLGGAKKPRTFAVAPVLCNGKIYCKNFAGDLVCVDVSR